MVPYAIIYCYNIVFHLSAVIRGGIPQGKPLLIVQSHLCFLFLLTTSLESKMQGFSYSLLKVRAVLLSISKTTNKAFHFQSKGILLLNVLWDIIPNVIIYYCYEHYTYMYPYTILMKYCAHLLQYSFITHIIL